MSHGRVSYDAPLVRNFLALSALFGYIGAVIKRAVSSWLLLCALAFQPALALAQADSKASAQAPPAAKAPTPAAPIVPTAAAPAAPSPASQSSYSAEPLVVERLSSIYRYRADGTGDRTLHVRARIQSEAAARQYGVLYVPYAADNEQVEMKYLRVHKADGATVETPSADAQDLPAEVTRQAPLYSDLRQKQFPVRSLSVGDTLEYECIIHLVKPQAVDTQGHAQFWGGETLTLNAVTLDDRVELHVPLSGSGDHAPIVISPHHTPQTEDQPGERGGERVYRWHTSRLKPTVPAAGSKDADDAEAGDGLPDISWTSFKEWAAVGDWYRSLAAGRAAPTPELKAKAAALTQGAATEEEKVRRIYSYVSTGIRYIGVDFGIGRMQPHPAPEVLGNQYGDCKDKHTLLQALLAASGVNASPVLIGSGIKFNRDAPSPASFNHVITAVELPADGGRPAERVFLDSTSEIAPYRVLTAPTRDKDALLVASGGPSVLVKTPAELPFRAYDHWEARGTLGQDGKLTGHFDITLRGDVELLLRWTLRQTTAAQWSQLGQNLSNNFGFSGTVTNFTPGSAEQTEAPLHYSYDYEKPSFGDTQHDRILSMIPYGLFVTQTLDKKPTDPIPTGTPRLESARSVIQLPEGWTAKLPDPVHVRSSFADYDVTYAAKDGAVICETKLEVRTTSLAAEKWEEYNAFAKGVQDNSEIFVQLNRPGHAAEVGAGPKPAAQETAGGPGGGPGVNDVNAAALLDEAWKLMQAGDTAGAEAKVEAARKINPDQWGALAMAGMIASMHNKSDEAEADFTKELALHAENDFALRSLAAVQVWRKERPQAIETLKKLVKLKPEEDGLTRQLAGLLTAEKRYPEALTLLQAAAFKNPGDKSLILQLGSTQLAAGRTEEAVATLHTALEDATDPLVLNDAAYQLALHDADLPLAEASAKKALALLDAESQKVSVSTVSQDQLNRMNLLAATWDTVGWIEFKKGDAKAAQSYLQPAWATAQHPEVGYHLGMALEKLGKPQAAYDIYHQAQATLHGVSLPSEEDLPGRLVALEKAGIAAKPGDAGNALGEERTYTLPLLTSKQSSGDYYLLLSAGKVEGASWIEGSPELKGYETKVAQALGSAIAGPGKPALFPTGSTAKMLRRGVLSCSPMLHSCMLALMLPQDVRIAPKLQQIQMVQAK